MKKLLVLTLGAVLLLTGCGKTHNKTRETEDDKLPNAVYWEDIETEEIIVEDIEVEEIIVEDISEESRYVSDEYLEELEANSRQNYWGR